MNQTRTTRWREPDKIAYTETFRTEKAIIRVHYPDISDEENARRKKILEKAMIEFWKDKIRRERECAKANHQ